jgi:hypothetical protein
LGICDGFRNLLALRKSEAIHLILTLLIAPWPNARNWPPRTACKNWADYRLSIKFCPACIRSRLQSFSAASAVCGGVFMPVWRNSRMFTHNTPLVYG